MDGSEEGEGAGIEVEGEGAKGAFCTPSITERNQDSRAAIAVYSR